MQLRATVKHFTAFSYLRMRFVHTIGLRSKKPSHAYPFIRLPREYSKLIGAKATIFETAHNGDLALLVVPHREHEKSAAWLQQPKAALYDHRRLGSVVTSTSDALSEASAF